jgi:lipopolysaccharide/colanic/teichoic acid biosynthesis glycosyltransferase
VNRRCSWIAFKTCKRLVDVVASASALILLAPVFAIVAIAIRWSSPGSALFRQERMGFRCRPFWMFKFRTMWVGSHEAGPLVTSAGDARATPLGRLLRASKLDELPQLWNVLRGDMSLVGPRPQTREYFDHYRRQYSRILDVVRPGITDFAAIQYRDEEGVLGQHAEPEREYIREVIPRKLCLYRLYVQTRSISTDFYILFRTVLVLLPRGPHEAWSAARRVRRTAESAAVETSSPEPS